MMAGHPDAKVTESVHSKKVLVILVLASILFLVVLPQMFKHEDVVPKVIGKFNFANRWNDVLHRKPISYAVFSANTPNGENHRGYDFAFNLPLTAMAWERLGFKSIVIIVGARCEWENDPTLTVILSHLQNRGVSVIFINVPEEYRSILSKTARLFVTNLEGFPGEAHDYVYTTDADLWPLQSEHFAPKLGKSVVLRNYEDRGSFLYKEKKIPLHSVNSIGATVSTWREMMKEKRKVVNDTDGIFQYLEGVFGKNLTGMNISPGPSSDLWTMDRKLISIRLNEWIERHGNESVYMVPQGGRNRLEHDAWEISRLGDKWKVLEKSDARVPIKPYIKDQWASIRHVINLLYGNSSIETLTSDQYFKEFNSTIENFLRFNEVF